MKSYFVVLACIGFMIPQVGQTTSVDLDVLNKIQEEGFYHSQVIKTLSFLTDDIGPRLTGTPNLKKANLWTKQKFAEWGLENNHLEGFSFGRGWWMNRFQVMMKTPRKSQVDALPIAWLPGTNGCGRIQSLFT